MTAPSRGPLASTGYWLHQAAAGWRRELGTRLRPLGLTPTQFDVLASTGWLTRGDSRPSQQRVADFAGIDRMMASKVIRSLEERGLVRRAADPDDARAVLLQITPEGRAMVTESTAIARAVDSEQFAQVSDPEALRAMLRQLTESPEAGNAVRAGNGATTERH